LGHYSALLLCGKWTIRRVINMHIANIFAEAQCFGDRWRDVYMWSYIHELCHDIDVDFHGREECELL